MKDKSHKNGKKKSKYNLVPGSYHYYGVNEQNNNDPNASTLQKRWVAQFDPQNVSDEPDIS